MPLKHAIDRTRRLRALPAVVRHALTALLVAVALGLELWLAALIPGPRFLLFFPAILLAAVLFDRGAGLMATALSALASVYLLMGPAGRQALDDPGSTLLLLLFIATGFFQAALVEGLRMTIDRLSASVTQVRRSEQEKTTLLAEAHHRIKNNLQVVAALLSMQAREVADPAARTALDAAIRRIAVMGRVHQRLENHNAGVVVDTWAFIGELCDDVRALLVADRPIVMRVDASSVPLDLGQAVPLGLIVNELVTNALKYGFPEGRPGAVTVEFRKDVDGLCRLRVEDDGIGVAPDSVPGLGQRLIRLMVEQLDGTIETTAGPGTAVRVAFPHQPGGR